MVPLTLLLTVLLATPQPPTRWTGRARAQHSGRIRALTVTADGRYVSSDGRWVRVWTKEVSTPAVSIDTGGGEFGHGALCVSPDGTLLFTLGKGLAAYALPSGEKRWEYPVNPYVNTGTFTPDCRVAAMALGSGDIQLFAPYAFPKAPARTLTMGRTNILGRSISGLALSTTGAWLAVSDAAASIELYEVATGERRAQLQPPIPSRLRTHEDAVSAMTFAGENELVALVPGKKEARSWKLEATPALSRWPLALESPWGMALAPDGHSLALSVEGKLLLVDVKERKLLRTVPAPGSGPLAWVGTGAVVLGTQDGHLERVALTGPAPSEPPRHEVVTWLAGLTFSPDGKLMATVVEERRRPEIVHLLELWDTASGQRAAAAEQTLSGSTLTSAVTFVPGTSTFYWHGGEWVLEGGQLRRTRDQVGGAVATSSDGKVRAVAFCYMLQVQDAQGKLVREFTLKEKVYTFPDGRGYIDHPDHCSVALSQEGARMVSWGDDELKLWNPRTGKLLRTMKKQGLEVPLFTPDLKTAWLIPTRYPAKTIRRLELGTGKEAKLPAPAHGVVSAAISHDGARLALAASDGSVELRDSKTSKVLRTLGGAECVPSLVVLSPGGDTLALGCERGAVALWDLRF
jgi:WD40 repeat protein